MATVNNQRANVQREFIGRAWINEVKKEGSNQGTKFLNLKIDRGIDLTLVGGDSLTLWPNKKREGKQDADFRVSVEIPA